MRVKVTHRAVLIACLYAGLNWLWPGAAFAQEGPKLATQEATGNVGQEDLRALAGLVRDLETQVQALNSQLTDMRAAQQRSSAETEQLRAEVGVLKTQLENLANGSRGQMEKTAYVPQQNKQSNPPANPPSNLPGYGPPTQPGSRANLPASSSADASSIAASASSTVREFPQVGTTEDRLSNLEEQLQLAHQEIVEQSQTKVESGSKYRLRLSGIVLLNLFSNQGQVNNQDFPAIATPPVPLQANNTFGGSLRQSQISLEAFGPDVLGAHTSADLRLDFGGGFPLTSNGSTMGIVRLRTGVVRFDWTNTSIIAGQDQLFFSPTNPTSLASLAVPPLAYAGNLWAWVPQVRVEHRVNISDDSRLLLAAGILDSLSGEVNSSEYDRLPTWGEQSGQPAYAARIAWSDRLFGRELVAGVGGYYGRQYWGLGRHIDSWTVTADLTVPLWNYFEFSSAFYRGRAVGGLGGAVGQSVLWNGNFTSAGTELQGLDSVGGWVQLKFRPLPKFEINAALGEDSPDSDELREYHGNPSYLGFLISRNLSPFINFIYEPRSNVVFSTEYRRLQTYILDSDTRTANLITISLGYIF
jgi:regulator of replication initiation timing